MLKVNLQRQIIDALKAKDEVRLSTLRLLLSAFKYEEIAKQHELTDDEEIAVVKRQLKQREDAVEALRQAQGKPTTSTADDLKLRLARETQEAAILKEFLPEQMKESELSELVNQAIEEIKPTGSQDFGKVMQSVMAKAAGQANGKTVSELVKRRLS